MPERNKLLDQWKLCLIALVVFGHSLPKSNPFFTAIYTFHMPAFVFLLGATSKLRPSVKSQIEVLVLLVFFQIWYVAEAKLWGWVLPRHWYLAPIYIMWFFASTFIWRGTLRFLLATGYPLLISIAISVTSGLVDGIGVDFAAARTLAFLPVFVAGHLYGSRLIAWAGQKRELSLSAALFPAGTALAFASAMYLKHHQPDVLYQSDSYHVLRLSALHGIAYRCVTLILGIVIAACFFAALNRPSPLAPLGMA